MFEISNPPKGIKLIILVSSKKLERLITRFRIIQDRFECKRKMKKDIRRHTYRLFLQNPNRQLPSFKTLTKYRRILFLTGFVCFLVPSLQVVLMYDTLGYMPVSNEYVFNLQTRRFEYKMTFEKIKEIILESLSLICGTLGMMCWFFSCMFDYAIYKRFHKNFFIEWFD